MTIIGAAWCLGDDVSTDEILPGRYMGLEEGPELGVHALEGIAPDVIAAMSRGDILVAGQNFGTGSSRESAPRALRAAGFSAVVAESFARIFYRNCINIGLTALWCDGVAASVGDRDRLVIDPAASRLTNESTGAVLAIAPLSAFAQGIVDAGGLVAYARARTGRSLVDVEECSA